MVLRIHPDVLDAELRVFHPRPLVFVTRHGLVCEGIALVATLGAACNSSLDSLHLP